MTMKNKTDEECLQAVLNLLETRVSIETSFIINPDSNLITHQVLKITCGEYTTVSQPEPLEVPMKLVGTLPSTTIN